MVCDGYALLDRGCTVSQIAEWVVDRVHSFTGVKLETPLVSGPLEVNTCKWGNSCCPIGGWADGRIHSLMGAVLLPPLVSGPMGAYTP